MHMEQSENSPEIRFVNSPADYNEIAKSLLEVIAGNESGALGLEIIAVVQEMTKFNPTEIGMVFQTFFDDGVVDRELDSVIKNGVVLTPRGRSYLQRFDELMDGTEQ